MINDSELITQLKDTHTKEKAFKELINRYKERLYWHIRKIVLFHEDADDVLQNTFIKIFRSIDQFKGQSKLYTWMYRIATNEAITFINRKAKEQKTSITEYTVSMANRLVDDNWFSGDEIQIVLQKAISTLPEKQRLVFNMKYFDDMKYQEISEVLEISVSSLKASYHHAVKKIQSFIKEANF